MNLSLRATREIALDRKLGIDATKKLPGEGFKRSWPPLIKMDENTRKKIDALFGGNSLKGLSALNLQLSANFVRRDS